MLLVTGGSERRSNLDAIGRMRSGHIGVGRRPSRDEPPACVGDDERSFLRLHLVSNAVIATKYGRSQQSSKLESFGRERLRDLMAGHTVLD